jgi:hypothetical protein
MPMKARSVQASETGNGVACEGLTMPPLNWQIIVTCPRDGRGFPEKKAAVALPRRRESVTVPSTGLNVHHRLTSL